MAVSINWLTKVITIPKSFMTQKGPTLYELDVNAFRIALKDIEDEEGMPYIDTHRHNSPVVLAGVTYARTLEIINGYTVTFEDGQYVVSCVGANHNLADVKNLNQVSLIVGNAAGLITYTQSVGGIGTVQEVKDAVWSATNLAAYGVGTAGEKLDSVGASSNPWLTDLTTYNTAGTAGKILKDAQTAAALAQTNTDTLETSITGVQSDLTTIKGYTDTLESSATAISGYVDTLETAVGTLQTSVDDLETQLATVPTAANIAAQVRTELTAELAHLMALQNGLTSGQATMLLESYRLLGLDPTKPLVVTKTSRTAGIEIQQTISGDTNTTTVTRI